jgi:hypothetical protein
MGAMALILFVSASNAGKVWMMRTMGEHEYLALVVRLARKSKLRHALLGVAGSCSFFVLAGLSILLFYPGPSEGMAFWFGLGVVVYAAAMGLHTTVAMRRIFAKAASAPAE